MPAVNPGEVWMTDFGGALTRSVSDLAEMLNA
jgi:hypothetical protein